MSGGIGGVGAVRVLYLLCGDEGVEGWAGRGGLMVEGRGGRRRLGGVERWRALVAGLETVTDARAE